MEFARLILDFFDVLVWPATVVILFVSCRQQVLGLFNRLRHADLPGGVSFDLQDAVNEAEKLSSEVAAKPVPESQKGPSIPLNEVNKRMIQVGLNPSPSGLDLNYYKKMIPNDPSWVLAGLRIEFEIMLRNLAKGFKVPTLDSDSGTMLLRKLYRHNAVDMEQMRLGVSILDVCNRAVHGTPVSVMEATSVIDSAEVVVHQYMSWLSWGFPKSK